MKRKEVDLAVEWAAGEGWNPGINDAECFYAVNANGFFIGVLDDEPIAVISTIKYGQSFGFLGYYIVKPEFRGKGYGIQIWKVGMDYLSGRNVGLDGVLAEQDNYLKSGFKLAYRNIRYEGLSGGNSPADQGLVDLSRVPAVAIEEYDRPFFPDTQSQFLQVWLNQPGSVALGILHKGKLSGYGLIRPCRSGYKIGPLFADNLQSADPLLVALKSSIDPGQPVYLDIPELNQDAHTLVENHNMNATFETARMYTGVFPELPANRCFGITSFELG